MAPDSSWDNSAQAPARKKGLGVFGKILIGCGAAALLFVLAIGGLVGWGFSKATSVLDRAWTEAYQGLEALHSDEGARALYRANPGLAQAYSSEAEFLAAAAEWRPKLGHIQRQRPDLRKLFSEGGGHGLSIQNQDRDGVNRMTVRVRTSTGTSVELEMERGRLTDIRVD